ncbi:MAG: NAD(P)-dependent oxidoreductase [Kiritimatiellae bacterium]|nr:NAD(P)-dependent oxidoreductase [Kiritimatiellia bacterium]
MNVLIGPSSFGEQNDRPLRRLREAGCHILPNPYKRRYVKEEIIRLLAGVDGLIAGLEPLDREVLESARGTLKVISRCGAGMSNVDQAAAKEFGIQVFNTPNGPTESVAEMTVGCLLAVMRQVAVMNAALHEGKWDKRTGSLLQGKTVAMVGYGRIGRRVAELLVPFGVNRLVVDPHAADTPTVSLDAALPQADVVLLHLSGESCVLDVDAFSRLKPGAFLCNAARGGAVDEAALVAALDSGVVAGAWLDALPKEPYAGPLQSYEQVLLTPHVASYTVEGRLNMELECVENLIRGLAL